MGSKVFNQSIKFQQLSMGWQWVRRYSFSALVLLLMWQHQALAQLSTSITVEKGQTLRDIAQAYLGNPDLWQVIAEFNDIDALSVSPGDQIRVPLKVVSDSNQMLEKAVEKISAAGSQGARIFAPEVYQTAIDMYNEALLLNRSGRLEDATWLLTQASDLADKAANMSRGKRVEQQSVVLIEITGRAQRRKRSDVDWAELAAGDVLVKDELIRTLSESSVVLQVGSNTIWRMSENSVAMIGNLFKDKLKNRQHTEVGLIEGDLNSVLGALTLNVDDKQLTFQGPLGVSRKGDVVSLDNQSGNALEIFQKNDSFIVSQDDDLLLGVSGVLDEVLRSVHALSDFKPESGDVIYNQNFVDLSWQANKRAALYIVEVARDNRFNQSQTTQYRTLKPSLRLRDLEQGRYFWRVRFEDENAVRGPQSNSHLFHLKDDDQPPYLLITSPKHPVFLKKNEVVITGVAEFEAQLRINEVVYETDETGAFNARVPLQMGENLLKVVVLDQAGNETSREVTAWWTPLEAIKIDFITKINRSEEGVLILEQGNTLKGRVDPWLSIDIYSTPLERIIARVNPDSDGFFQIHLDPDYEDQQLIVSAPTGALRSYKLKLSGNRALPNMIIEKGLPAVTATVEHPIRLCFVNVKAVSFEGSQVPLKDGCLERKVRLKDGANQIRMSAVSSTQVKNAWTLNTFLDRKAPSFVRHRIERHEGNNYLRLWVKALDGHQLAKTARFELRSDNEKHTGIMSLDPEQDSYTALVEVGGDLSDWHLRSVDISDYSGHSAQRLFSRL